MPAYVRSLALRCLSTFFELLKIMLPVMLLVRLGDIYGLTDALGRGLAPLMGLVDLPAEAGLIWAITILTSLYGGVGAFVSLQPDMQLTIAQVSVLSTLMLFAHALPVEQAIVRRRERASWRRPPFAWGSVLPMPRSQRGSAGRPGSCPRSWIPTGCRRACPRPTGERG